MRDENNTVHINPIEKVNNLNQYLPLAVRQNKAFDINKIKPVNTVNNKRQVEYVYHSYEKGRNIQHRSTYENKFSPRFRRHKQ